MAVDENGDFIQSVDDFDPYAGLTDQQRNDVFKAADEYYGKPGSQTVLGPNNFVNSGIDIAGHAPVNWQDPSSYQYLINTPGSTVNTPGALGTATTTTAGGGGSIGTMGFQGLSRPQYNFTPAPAFNAPQFKAPDPFKAPNAEDVLNDPGYGFRLNQGRQALEQSSSGKGILRTGGTLKDILGYGQALASQEYSNVYGRAADTYDRNYGVSRDVFDRTYTGAKDTYAPTFADWQMRQAAEQRAGDLEFARQWDIYTYGVDDAFRRSKAVLDAADLGGA